LEEKLNLASVLFCGLERVMNRLALAGKNIQTVEFEKLPQKGLVPKLFDSTRFLEKKESRTVSVAHLHKQLASEWETTETMPRLMDYMQLHTDSYAKDIKNCQVHFLSMVDETTLPSKEGMLGLSQKILEIMTTFDTTQHILFMDKYQNELQFFLKSIFEKEDKDWNDQLIRNTVMCYCLDQVVQLEKTIWLFYFFMNENRKEIEEKFQGFDANTLYIPEDVEKLVLVVPPQTQEDLKNNLDHLESHFLKQEQDIKSKQGALVPHRLALAKKWFTKLMAVHDDKPIKEQLDFINKHGALFEIFNRRSHSSDSVYNHELLVLYKGEYMGHVHVSVDKGQDKSHVVTMIGIRSSLNYMNRVQPCHTMEYALTINRTMLHSGYPIPKISSLILYGISRVCKHRQTSKKLFYFKVTKPIGFIMPHLLDKNGISGVRDQGIRVDKLIRNMDDQFLIPPFFLDYNMTYNHL
jgi:hypothetical protein